MSDNRKSITHIALTGGSGFVGSHILKNLLARGYHVRALIHRSALIEHENLHTVKGSLDNANSLAELVQGCQCVIHCGGAVAARNTNAFFNANKKGTENIVHAAEKEGVDKFLYLSSIAAREPSLSAYAASKLGGEDVFKTCSIPHWDVIRPPAIYGPGDVQLLPLMKLISYRIALLPAGRDARVSMIYVEDLANAVCDWIESDSESESESGQIYEIDDDNPGGYRWPELMKMAAEAMEIRPHYIVPPHSLLIMVGWIIKIFGVITGKQPFLTPDKLNELSHPDWVRREKSLNAAIKWRPQTDFAKGIVRTLNWYKKTGLLTR